MLRPSTSRLSNEPVRGSSAQLALDELVRLALVAVRFRSVAGRVRVGIERVLRHVVCAQVRVGGQTLEETLARVFLRLDLLVVCLSVSNDVKPERWPAKGVDRNRHGSALPGVTIRSKWCAAACKEL